MNTKQEAVNQPVITLPVFTEVISIEIEVNDIYEKLKSEFPNDYKHKELVAHTIIGTGLNNGGLSYLYNALNGFTSAIDFKVGEKVICKAREKYQRYDSNIEDSSGNRIAAAVEAGEPGGKPNKPNWKTRTVEIGECEIIEVNIYRSEKLRVKFLGESHYNNDGQLTEREAWVSHKLCTKVPVENGVDVYVAK